MKGMKGILVILSLYSIYSLSEGAVCKDKFPTNSCRRYVVKGFCVANQWVQGNCKLSCGICTPLTTASKVTAICSNVRKDSECKEWIKYYCAKPTATKPNQWYDFMQIYCKKSCGWCGKKKSTSSPTASKVTTATASGNCKDEHPTTSHCIRYKDSGYCANYSWVRKNCKKTCDICGTATITATKTTLVTASGNCKDEHPITSDCIRYKDNGYCATNSWTRKNCKKTCDICGIH